MSGTNCPNCGALNQAAAQVCIACGEMHDWEPVIDPNRPLSDIAPFGTDSAVSETFSIFTSNLWLITKIVVVAVAPFELFRAISLVQLGEEFELPLLNLLLNGVSKVWVVPALIYALMKIMLTGREPSVHEAYRWALTKAGKLGLC